MYESPIKITEITEDIAGKLMSEKDAYIMQTVTTYVDVNKDELIKALKYDRDQYNKGYKDRDNEIVRCEVCVHYDTQHELFDDDVCLINREVDSSPRVVGNNDFCKWGIRRKH